MPDTDHFTGLPVPLDGESSYQPTLFGNFRDALGGHTVLYATSKSQRNADYATVPIGTIVCSTSTADVWRKVPTAIDPSGWKTIFADTGWVSLAGASFNPEWSDNGSKYRILFDFWVILYWNAVFNGTGETIPNSGNIDDRIVMTVPTAITPGIRMPGEVATATQSLTGRCIVNTSSELRLTHIYAPTDTFPSSNTYEGLLQYPVDITP